MSKQEDVINRAYGNVPREVGYNMTWDFVPTLRGIKYYWYKLIRRLKGRSSTACDCGHKH
jgi:hypothetical protein